MKNKEIMSIIAIALAAQTAMSSNAYASGIKLNEDKIVGKNRYETAIEVSKKGWINGATNAVLVNDSSIVDALSATPFANAKNAPILLTKKDTLNEETKQQLKTLGVKNVYIIGGESVVSKKIEEQLRAENIKVDRIQGKNREATSVEIAKRLNDITPVKKVSVVNGYKGLADAVSIAAISANENMPIILSGMDNISKEVTEFIDSKAISKSYIVGGDGVVSNNLKNKLPNAERIAGKNRKETNAQVINTFFTEKEINNLYIAKDGAQNENQLIDALSVGSLAAKTNSPIMIVGNSLDKSQKDLINSKSFKTITQVGGSGNEIAFNEIKNIQNEVIASKPNVDEDSETVTGPEQVPSNPTEKPSVPEKPEQAPSVPEEKPSVPAEPEKEPTVSTKPEQEPSVPEQDSSDPEENDPVYPENITLYNSREGKNDKGLGDTTYEELKKSGWNVDPNGVLSTHKGRIKFENLNGKNKEDARITIKAADAKVDKAALYVLKLMNGKESQYTAEQLGYIISSGTSTIKDGSRYIDIKYNGDIYDTLTITFSNFGITPIHEAIEGDNEYGFGDTTYKELKNSGWNVDSNGNKVSSSKGNVSFTNVNGKDGVDATIDVKNGFNKNDGDLLYALSLMLNSNLEAEKLADKIQNDYNEGTIKTIISGNTCVIIVDIPEDKSPVKITFKNIYSSNIEWN